MKKPYAFLLILLSAVTMAAPAFAQVDRSQLHFLEQFAIRQYERGDRENALKQFGWILRIEPNNAIAREYLQKMSGGAAPAGTPPAENRSQVIADISNVRSNLTQYEEDTKELERIIRDLITENDALYQVLYKRSREVAEMRQKFYGTPYEQAYLDALKSVPIDRVPQRLHRKNDILPENTAGTHQIKGQELAAVIKDITALNEEKPGTVNEEKLDAILRSTRAILLQKNMTLAEKNNSLNQLKEALTDINSGLKTSNNRYVDALQKIDGYYSRIKERMAKKNYVEQKMFSELISDYASKLKEIEALKSSVRTRDNTLTSFKPGLQSSNDRLSNINNELRTKDSEIARFRDMADAYKQQLAERDAKLNQRNEIIRHNETLIQSQKNGLSLTDQKLNDVDSLVTRIEQELKNGDIQLAQLKANIIQPKRAAAGNTPDLALKEEVVRLKTSIEQAKQEATIAQANITRMTAREQELLTKSQALEKENAALRQTTQDAPALRNDIEKKNARISELSTRIAVMQQDLRSLRPISNAKRADGKDTDLEARLSQSYKKLTAAETELTRNMLTTAELKEQLMKRDAEIETLKATPSIKIKADKKLLMDALLLKDQELTAAKEHLKDLQRNHDLLALENARTPEPAAAAIPIKKEPPPAPALKEKTAGINPLQEELALAKEAVKIAEARAKTAEEKYASREIKQDAIDEVIQKRDTRIETLMTEILALKDELAAEKSGQAQSLAKADDAASARIIAEKELKTNTDELSKLHTTVKDLVSDIKSAKAMVEKKSRDHDATLRELRRLSDTLDQKKEELNSLQRRVSGTVKKAPADTIKVTAPDCFKDCPPKVK